MPYEYAFLCILGHTSAHRALLMHNAHWTLLMYSFADGSLQCVRAWALSKAFLLLAAALAAPRFSRATHVAGPERERISRLN